jgi:prepilin-type N-terminal cleavage/methylation domain-containing protein
MKPESRCSSNPVRNLFALVVGGALCPDHFSSPGSRCKTAPTTRLPIHQKRTTRLGGFTLIEVLLSLGIMSVALLIVFGILTPFLTQTGEVVETSTVNRITDRISAEVADLSYDQLKDLLNSPELSLFSSRDGNRLVTNKNPELETLLPEADRHFAISLSRIEDISPPNRDSIAGFLAFQIKIERLIHAPDGSLINSPLDQTLAVFNTAVLKSDS